MSTYENYCENVQVVSREFCQHHGIKIAFDEGNTELDGSPLWSAWGDMVEESEFWFILDGGETTPMSEHELGQELLEMVDLLAL